MHPGSNVPINPKIEKDNCPIVVARPFVWETYTRQGTSLSLSLRLLRVEEATAATATAAAAPEQRWHTVKAWRCIRYSTRSSSVCSCYMFDMDLCGVILCLVCSFIHTPIVRTDRTSVHITLLCTFVCRSCSGPAKSINYTTKDTVYFVLLIEHKRTTNDQTQTATATILRKARFRAVCTRTAGCHRPPGRRLPNILRHMNGEYGVGVWRVGARFQILCVRNSDVVCGPWSADFAHASPEREKIVFLERVFVWQTCEWLNYYFAEAMECRLSEVKEGEFGVVQICAEIIVVKNYHKWWFIQIV